PGRRSRRAARLQAHDHPRLQDSLEQLRLRLPVVRGARATPRRAQGGSTGQVRLATAPPLRRSRIHLERLADARNQREPRVRRGVPGLSRRRLSDYRHLAMPEQTFESGRATESRASAPGSARLVFTESLELPYLP